MNNLKSREEVNKIMEILKDYYPQPQTVLQYTTPFELLIAVILSAQSTDKQVNKVTKELFEEFKRPSDYINLASQELEPYIKGVGLYRNKSKYIIKTCQLLVEKYNGKVPDSREELMELSGVGRKTANVVLSSLFGVDTIAVDTHVFRVANRIGLADSNNVRRVEEDLMKTIPQKLWSKAHHWLIFHGRNICKARKIGCEECPITKYCNYYKNQAKSSKS